LLTSYRPNQVGRYGSASPRPATEEVVDGSSPPEVLLLWQPRVVLRMIRPGTLLIEKGTKLPTWLALKGDPSPNAWTPVESGPELLQLKADLAHAGWNYFYMGVVTHTVFGSGPKRIASAVEGVVSKMHLKNCNSLQIDSIAPHSWLGIPYVRVSAHCCQIQESIIFTGGKQ